MICEETRDGIPYVEWVNFIFGDCVYGKQGTISLLLGYLSILCWLNAQLPQVIKNYKQSSAEGLSSSFLSIWLAGDTANLIGTILTDQLPFQFYLAIYFVFVDIILLVQWIYYNKYNQHIHDDYIIINPDIQREENKINNSITNQLFHHPAEIPIQNSNQSMFDEFTPFSSSASPSKWYTLNESTSQPKTFMSIFLLFSFYGFNPILNDNSSLFLSKSEENHILWLGRLFAWTCTCFYLMSRIPQMIKNYRRQSVEGLSASLFVFAACGNLTYASSVLSYPGQTLDSIIEALPYLIGSAGTLAFDFTIFCQFMYYKNHKNKYLNTII